MKITTKHSTHRIRLAVASLSLALSGVGHAGSIVLVTNDEEASADFVSDLEVLGGHTVTTGPFDALDTTPEDVVTLNAADLVIVSRNTTSGDYADNPAEVAAWDGVTTPVLLGSAWISRNNRWSWIDTDATQGGYNGDVSPPPEAETLHPWLYGLEDDGPGFTGRLKYGFTTDTDIPAGPDAMGDGEIIGIRNNADNQNVILARWPAGGVTGSGNPLGGERYFFAMPGDFGNHTENGYKLLDNLIGSFFDTDGDGLTDAHENLIIRADDADDVEDFGDVAGPGETPATDFDGDGRTDAEEFAEGVTADRTNPIDPDTDADGLDDGPEIAGTDNGGTSHGFGPTDPNIPDTDGDGFDDGAELRFGSDPNDADSVPGDEVALVNGGFEEPPVETSTEGVAVSGGSVPGWTVVENDFYVLDAFADAGSTTNPTAAYEGNQFATSARNAPEPDVEAEEFSDGIDSAMSMRQVLDASSFASEIDQGARTLLLDYAFVDNDGADTGRVTVEFLDASGEELGRPSTFQTPNSGLDWVLHRQAGYPPVGTRSFRITVEGFKNGTGGSSIRNVHFDDFRARLAFADSDDDGLPDDWELRFGLDPDDDADAAPDADADEDGLSNTEEFERGTDPSAADTDGDGVSDVDEVEAGTDPLDPESAPEPDIKVVDVILNKDGSGEITEVEVVFSGVIPGMTYSLFRGTDMEEFSTVVDTFTPDEPTESFFDFNPLPGETSERAFYQLEDVSQ